MTDVTTRTEHPASTSRDETTLLVTSLFAGGPARIWDGVSPAGAFQDALFARSVLIDVRPLAERVRTGQVDPRLFGAIRVTDDAQDSVSGAYLATLDRPGVPAHILGSGEAEISVIVHGLRRLGVDAQPVEGGFGAWRAAGLPVVGAKPGPSLDVVR